MTAGKHPRKNIKGGFNFGGANKPSAKDLLGKVEPFHSLQDDDFFEGADEDTMRHEESSKKEGMLDADLAPQKLLLQMAEENLPATPQVKKVFELAPYITLGGVLSAIILFHEMGEVLPGDELDCLVAAALLSTSPDVDDVYEFFDRKVMHPIDEILSMTMQEDMDDRREEVAQFSFSARHIFFANIVADLEMIRKELKDGKSFSGSGGTLDELASFIIENLALAPINLDLQSRLATVFNAAAEEAGLTVRLQSRRKDDADNSPAQSGKRKPKGPSQG